MAQGIASVSQKISFNFKLKYKIYFFNFAGMRFALMEVKACLVYLLHKYSFVVVPKTQIPLKLSKNPFQLTAEDGFWLGMKPKSSEL